MNKNKIDETAITYEANIRYLVEISNKRAWLIAFIFAFIAIVSIIAISILTPLKSVEPYVIRVDNVSGQVDIITSLKKEELTTNEALDKYFVSQYVKLREGYYYDMLPNDFKLVQIYSSPAIASEYIKLFQGDNAKQFKLGDVNQIEVNIKSVTLNHGMENNVASVRFDLITKDKENNSISNVQSKIVTLSYKYDYDFITDEEERLKNPLGFKVLTYRIDNEIGR